MDDFRGASFLYTLATLMVTFAGFSALLLTVRQAIGDRPSVLDRFDAYDWGHRRADGRRPAAGAVEALRAARDLDMENIGVAGLFYLALLLTFPRRRMAITGQPPPRVIAVTFVGLGAARHVFMIAWILADFAQPACPYHDGDRELFRLRPRFRGRARGDPASPVDEAVASRRIRRLAHVFVGEEIRATSASSGFIKPASIFMRSELAIDASGSPARSRAAFRHRRTPSPTACRRPVY